MQSRKNRPSTPWRRHIVPALMVATGAYFLCTYLRVHGLSGLLAL